jgi:hypothetical protein
MPFNHFDIISPIYERFGRFDRSHPMMNLLDAPTDGLVIDIGGGKSRIDLAHMGKGRGTIVLARAVNCFIICCYLSRA